MPSTGFGPLVEPGWAGGATMPGQPDLGGKFLNAFYIGSEINRRKAQLENQVAAMAIKAQQNEFMDKLRERDFNNKLDQEKLKYDLAEQRLGLQGDAQNLAALKLKNIMDLQQKSYDDNIGFSRHMAESGVSEDDPNYLQEAWSAMSLYPNADKKILEDITKRHNARGDTLRKSLDMDTKAIDDELKSHGINIGGDLTPFRDPKSGLLKDYRTVPTQADIDEDRPGEGRPLSDDRAQFDLDPKTGQKIPTGTFSIKVPGPVDQKTGLPSTLYKHITDKYAEELIKRVGDIDRRKASLPRQYDVPSSGAAVHVTNDADYNRLQAGQSFYWIDSRGLRHEGTRKPWDAGQMPPSASD